MAEHMYRKGVEIDPLSYRAHINLIVYLSEHGKQKKQYHSNISNVHLKIYLLLKRCVFSHV